MKRAFRSRGRARPTARLIVAGSASSEEGDRQRYGRPTRHRAFCSTGAEGVGCKPTAENFDATRASKVPSGQRGELDERGDRRGDAGKRRGERTGLVDLSPLHRMPLEELRCDFPASRDADLLRAITTLNTINGRPVAEFWKDVKVE
jgi:hypothetical protein